MKIENQFLVYEEGDCPLVNRQADCYPSPNLKRYIVKLWTGYGYTLGGFLAWATEPEWALTAVVAWIQDHPEYEKYLATKDVNRLICELTTQDKLNDDEIDNIIDESYALINCLYDGADINEYVRRENLRIIEAPQEYYHWYK